MSESRITELETKLAFAEDLLETLNQTVIRQQRQLDSLQEQLRLLHQQIRDNQSDAEPTTLREEIPPHY
jgi:SlyX protein